MKLFKPLLIAVSSYCHFTPVLQCRLPAAQLSLVAMPDKPGRAQATNNYYQTLKQKLLRQVPMPSV
jgi:hypothetical protein